MFGISLRECFAQDDARHHLFKQQAAASAQQLPISVLQTPCLFYTGIEFIIKHGLDEEGIFRLAGSKNVLDNLIQQASTVSI